MQFSVLIELHEKCMISIFSYENCMTNNLVNPGVTYQLQFNSQTLPTQLAIFGTCAADGLKIFSRTAEFWSNNLLCATVV